MWLIMIIINIVQIAWKNEDRTGNICNNHVHLQLQNHHHLVSSNNLHMINVLIFAWVVLLCWFAQRPSSSCSSQSAKVFPWSSEESIVDAWEKHEKCYAWSSHEWMFVSFYFRSRHLNSLHICGRLEALFCSIMFVYMFQAPFWFI